MIIGILIYSSCQKTLKNYSSSPEINVKLVSEDTAINIATNFNSSSFFNESSNSNNYPIKSTLNGKNIIKSKFVFNDSYNNPALYVFNFADNKGFIFVSADYQMQPILAYVHQGEFKKDIVPSALIQWVNRTMENIEIVRKGLYDNSKVANSAWLNYYSKNTTVSLNGVQPVPEVDPCASGNPPPSTSYTVGPLLSTTWGQACSYNDQCPNISCNLNCGNG